jgi:branched-chain amino acid transport system substrate-binding protein
LLWRDAEAIGQVTTEIWGTRLAKCQNQSLAALIPKGGEQRHRLSQSRRTERILKKGGEIVKKRILFIALASVLALSVGLIGCGGEEEEQAPDYIKIGYVTETEGMYAGFGQAGLWGEEAAIADVNALGGVYVQQFDKKIPLKLYTRESQSDETAVASCVEYLIDTQKVHAIVGACIPPTMVAATVPICEDAKIPQVNFPGPYEPWMAMRAEYEPVTYTFTSTFRIATELVPPQPGYLIKSIGFDFHAALGVDKTDLTVGVYASDDGDGRSWFELMGAMLNATGYKTSTWKDGKGLFPMDTKDYSAIINEWKADGVNAIWGNCPAPHFKDLWTQALAAGLQPKVVFCARAGLFWTDMKTLGRNAIGLGLENWWSSGYDPVACPGFGNTTPESLYDRYHADTGYQENPNIGWGYANIQVIVDAIQRAGSLDGTAIRDALKTTNLKTIAYNIKYDPSDLNSPIAIHYFQWFWDASLGTVVPKVVVSKHSFLSTTGNPFLITYPQ